MFTQNMLNYITRGKYSVNGNFRFNDPNTYTYKRSDGSTYSGPFDLGRIPIIEAPPYCNGVQINPIVNGREYYPQNWFCFDSSNEPAKIEDFKAIEPIQNIIFVSQTVGVIGNNAKYYFTFRNNNSTEITINSIEIFGTAEAYSQYLKNSPVFLLYREVFDAPLAVPAQGVFLYTMEITTGDTTGTTTGDTNA